MWRRYLMFIWFGLLLSSAIEVVAEQQGELMLPVKVYGYHLKPPFIIDSRSKRGLYYDFSRYINSRLGKNYLDTEYMPRKRLESRLQRADFDGLIIGVNPIWFRDAKEEKYFWTAPITRDRDEVISSVALRFEYKNPESLIGKTIGLSLGYYYYGIDELVALGKIERQDTHSELQNLDKLQRGRIDVAIISRSTFDYYNRYHRNSDIFHISEKPHDEFDRRILIPKHLEEVFQTINPIIMRMPHDPAWLAVLEGYR